ncbi:MAG: 50S ribosomal protein L24 [Lachnospiraceae bacterium]|nr:50S ribosomal protein L24 [Lachnospiraceae bacterium]
MATLKIKVGDNVRVIAGKDKGKEGEVLKIDHKAGKVIVKDLNMITKHKKQQGQDPTGGIQKVEGPIDISNVMLVVGGKTTRVGFEVRDGKKVRIAKATGEVIG